MHWCIPGGLQMVNCAAVFQGVKASVAVLRDNDAPTDAAQWSIGIAELPLFTWIDNVMSNLQASHLLVCCW